MKHLEIAWKCSICVVAVLLCGYMTVDTFRRCKNETKKTVLPIRFWVGDTMDAVALVQGAPMTLSGPDKSGMCIWYYDGGRSVMFQDDTSDDHAQRVTQWQVPDGREPLKVGKHAYNLK